MAAPGGPVAAPGGSTGPRRAEGAAERALVAEAWSPGRDILVLAPGVQRHRAGAGGGGAGPVLVVAPTVARAASGCATSRRRGVAVALLPGDWAQARAGCEVVIGARSAVWGPCPGLVAIVVLDAHDEGLVQEQAPTWDAPTVAAERARRSGVPCLWVSACPTVEMLAAAGHRAHRPSLAVERDGWSVINVVDQRRADPRAGLYSEDVAALRSEPRRVVCVLNRKGRAVLLDCASCAEVVRCERCACAVRLVGAELQCARCGESRPVVCSACGSDSLRSLARLGDPSKARTARGLGWSPCR